MAVPLILSDVPDVTPYIQYVASNGQTVFPYPFPITQDSDLVVVQGALTLNTDAGYTLSGQGNDTGGNVTFTLGQVTGTIITLYRDIAIERVSQFAQNSGFSSATFNAEFNNIYLIMQQLESSLSQALQIPNTNNPSPVTVLTPANYAGKYLSFDAFGNPTPALLTSSGSLTQAIIAGLLNLQLPWETSAGLAVKNFLFDPGQPERYIASFTYGSDTTGTTGSDISATVNAILAASQPVLLSPNCLYTFGSTINVPAAGVIRGAGMWISSLCAKPSLVGPAITETGNDAAKIVLTEFGLYCNNAAAMTHAGIYLGYQNTSEPFGTNGWIHNVYVAECAAGILGFDVNCNIANFGVISATSTAGVRIKGSGSSVISIINEGASGFADVNSNQTATELYDVQCGQLEVEAAANGVLSLTISGSVDVVFYPSLLATSNISELIYLTNRAASWRVHVPTVYYGGSAGTFATFTNLFYDQTSALPFGIGNPSNSAANVNMAGTYQSGSFVYGPTLAIKKQLFNAFTLKVVNTSGTLQHSISAMGSPGTAGNLIGSITGESATLVNTPTGTDSSTAFANGGKIGSASPSVFIFQSGAEITGDFAAMAGAVVPVISGGTTAYSALVFPQSVNVNGVTQVFMSVQLLNAQTGAAVNWATALGSSGNLIEIPILGFFK